MWHLGVSKRTEVRTVTWLPKFLAFISYHFFLPMVLSCASERALLWLATFSLCLNELKYIPADSHPLCVSLTPVDLRHRSHASRTFSQAWLTNPDKLSFNTWENNEHSIQKGVTWLLWVLFRVLTKSKHAQTSSDIPGHFRQRSEVFGKLSEIFGSRRDVSGNPGLDKLKISRIWPRKSWQV